MFEHIDTDIESKAVTNNGIHGRKLIPDEQQTNLQ